MDKIEKYIDELLEKSTPDRPIWNIEKINLELHRWMYDQGNFRDVCHHKR